MKIIVASFGYRFGTPLDADLLIDARSLANPFKIPHLRALDGTKDQLYDFVTKQASWGKWFNSACHQSRLICRQHIDAGMPTVAIGVGCVGGRHRSVVGALEIARVLFWEFGEGKTSWSKVGNSVVQIAHRDLSKGGEAGTFKKATDFERLPTHLKRKKEFKT